MNKKRITTQTLKNFIALFGFLMIRSSHAFLIDNVLLVCIKNQKAAFTELEPYLSHISVSESKFTSGNTIHHNYHYSCPSDRIKDCLENYHKQADILEDKITMKILKAGLILGTIAASCNAKFNSNAFTFFPTIIAALIMIIYQNKMMGSVPGIDLKLKKCDYGAILDFTFVVKFITVLLATSFGYFGTHCIIESLTPPQNKHIYHFR